MWSKRGKLASNLPGCNGITVREPEVAEERVGKAEEDVRVVAEAVLLDKLLSDDCMFRLMLVLA